MKKNYFSQLSALSQTQGELTEKSDATWYSKSVPCRTACPANTDIPSYLEAIYQGDYEKAYNINLEDNVFPEILGRVCSRPCEDACRHSNDDNGESVAICFSKRSAGDHRNFSKKNHLKQYAKNTRKKIAVVGSGVAGLACARELRRYGHTVEIYEKHKTPGGMLNQGIPIFRLPRDVIDREINNIISMGVKIHLRHPIETKEQLDFLSKEYDAVVLAMGTLKPNTIDKNFSKSPDIEDGLDFLLRVNEYDSKYIGKRVVIIGGGYTSMDCSRTALRLGAKSVKTFYRRDQGDLVILPGELDELKKEKGNMIFNARPIRPVIKNGKLDGLELIETTTDKNGKLKDRRGSKFIIKTDHIILAIGQKQHMDAIKHIANYSKKIRSSINSSKFQKNIFTAGDFALGATTLIDAIGHAKKTADKIDNFLMQRIIKRTSHHVKNVSSTNRNLQMNYIPMSSMPTLKDNRRNNNKEVELGYSQKQSQKEASRCYLCHYKFEINNNLCVLCDECLLVKPVEKCIVEVKETYRLSNGDTQYKSIEPSKTNGIYHGKLYIDHKKCIRCGECEKACPTGAITIQKIEERCSAKA